MYKINLEVSTCPIIYSHEWTSCNTSISHTITRKKWWNSISFDHAKQKTHVASQNNLVNATRWSMVMIYHALLCHHNPYKHLVVLPSRATANLPPKTLHMSWLNCTTWIYPALKSTTIKGSRTAHCKKIVKIER